MSLLGSRSGARALGAEAHDRIAEVLDADPVAGCLVAERFEVHGAHGLSLGASFWGVGGGRDALAFVGGNLVPLSGDPAALRRLAVPLARRGRTVASMVGTSSLVLPLWEALMPSWGVAREVRPDQPLLICSGTTGVTPDPRVRPVGTGVLTEYFPAAVAMFTEEVGVDPRRGDNGTGYRARVTDLMRRGLAFAIVEDGRILFKAEVGALSSRVALIQGVWVDPAHRGSGIAAPALAAVVRHIRDVLGRLPALYVNRHNVPALATYHRVGFHQVGTFASVLF